MKKVVLSLAIVAAMFVSCKENAAEADATVDTVVAEEVVVEEAPTVDTLAVEVEVPATEAAPEAAPAK